MTASRIARSLRLAGLTVAFAFAAAPLVSPAQKVLPVTNVNADEVLQHGDVMIKLISEKSQATSWGIVVSQHAIKELYSKLSEAARTGNAAAVHVAMYVGKGETAEAHGQSDHDNPGVGLRKVGHHAGYLWIVYRPKDSRAGEAAAKVARRWATKRMGYRTPWDTPLHNSNFGTFAKRDALAYGKAADTRGGPSASSEMFCSQFVIAAYQAAIVSKQLQSNPKLDSDDIKMLAGMDRHAQYTSPLVMHGHLDNSEGFRKIGLVVTQTAPAVVVPSTPLRPPEGPVDLTPKLVSLKGHAGKCLDAEWLTGKRHAGKGSRIHLWDCNGNPNQKWRFANGRLESAVAGLCLAVHQGKLESGRELVLWDCHTGNDERWNFRNGKLVVSTTKLCADVKQESRVNGAPIILYACGPDGKFNQHWAEVP